jgi:hypothetical protein
MSLSAPTPSSRIAQFVGMLPSLPITLPVFAPAGGVVEITIVADEGSHVALYAPDSFSAIGTEIEAQLRDDEGNGYDVKLRVKNAFFQGGDRTLVHVAVDEIVPRSGVREAPRAKLTGVASARVVFSSLLPAGHEFQVRLADASTSGVAFITDMVPAIGDKLAVEVPLSTGVITLDALVAHVDPAAFGRNRVGCEVRVQNQRDRDALAEVAASVETEADSEQNRRPEVGDALAQRRNPVSALQQRLDSQRSA